MEIKNRTADYELIAEEIRELAKSEPHWLPVFANTSAVLYDALPDLNWAGFYLTTGDAGLLLGPFQGKPACIRIPCGRGVCGTALAEDRIVRVPDVHAFPGHSACDSASRSEIVLPVHAAGPADTCIGGGNAADSRERRVFAVLDIDSPVPERFTEEDEAGLAQIVRVLEETVNFGGGAVWNL